MYGFRCYGAVPPRLYNYDHFFILSNFISFRIQEQVILTAFILLIDNHPTDTDHDPLQPNIIRTWRPPVVVLSAEHLAGGQNLNLKISF